MSSGLVKLHSKTKVCVEDDDDEEEGEEDESDDDGGEGDDDDDMEALVNLQGSSGDFR